MTRKLLYLTIIAITSINLSAQNSKLAKAEEDYEKYAYVDAIKTYERIFENGYKSPDMLQKLGNSYYFNANLQKAAKWYGELFAMTEDLDAEYFFRYAQSLKGIQEYAKADAMMMKFNAKVGNDSRGILHAKNKNYLAEIKKNSGRYTIENAGINSKFSDYGPSFYKSQIVFTSARDTGNTMQKKHTWSGEYFTNFYVADMAEDGSLGSVAEFGKKLNTRYHEATPVFTKDGKTVYFTRNNYLNGKKGKDGNRTILIKVYKATLEGDQWKNVTELPFNSDNYSVAHPALSADNKTLYFASDMPGTLGQSDIFKVKINEDGSYGTPENLGSSINTEGKETFPFVSANDELYFASSGHPGLGGLDIFISKIEKDGSYKEVLNIGEPANSPMDDFAFIINTKNKRGFLTSNREGGDGSDDIYKFLETKEIEFFKEIEFTGVVTDPETEEVLSDVKLTLLDEKFNKIKEINTDKNGQYDFGKIDRSKKYYVRAELPKYNTKEVPVDFSDKTGKINFKLDLERSVKRLKVGDDLAKAFGIKIIYFDLDKWNIRKDASIDLAKIVDVMKEYPNMSVDVRSHTDSRQSHAYNEKLSDRRAKSTMEWMIKVGIEKGRLTGKGYGETRLLNKCADGVPCSEAEHQQNRRSEFIITAL
jgi:outer membrane protein OmpA-like peptidoglycan-associated protein/tetratricopeptide (TPR) repeat protein